MSKIVVSPAQYVTCRLCLEELGNYQIVPSVVEQIAYCFGIEVQPYDGLPQLICQKCEEILNSYSKIKKKFIEKQEKLKGKVNNALGSQSIGKLSGALKPNEESRRNVENESNKENINIPPKKKPCISSSSSDEDYDNTDNKTVKNETTGKRSYGTDVTWPGSYKKQFVCRICNSHWYNDKILKIHFNKRHAAIYKKYGYIFKRNCQVSLNKEDGKDNITGSKSRVVLSKEKIVKNVSAQYHIIYTSKDYKGDKEDIKNKVKTAAKMRAYFSSDSSDEDLVVKRKKRRHFDSKSSDDTVVLENRSNASYDNNEESPESCINLDDSSESESEKNTIVPEKQESGDNSKGEQSIISEIISSCQNKYMKKHYQDTNLNKNPSEIANKLQHKIFSIGRKVINKKKGFNCTPLLRFLDNKSLDIAWMPKEMKFFSQDSNYIRIFPRRKTLEEKMEDKEAGWTDYITTSQSGLVTELTNNSSSTKKSQARKTVIKVKKRTEQVHIQSNASIPESASIHTSDSQSSRVLDTPLAAISESNHASTEIKKLLNANPVANPKQLPKKFITNEVKMAKLTPIPSTPHEEETRQEDNDTDLCMPIITSTTSLAALSIQCESSKIPEVDNTKHDKQPEGPRIKIKPMSELMSAETLNRMQIPVQNSVPTAQNSIQSPMTVQNQVQNVGSPIQNSMHIPISILGKGLPLCVQNVTVPVSMPVFVAPQPMFQPINYSSLIAPEPAWQTEFMLLDTVELPNTKTNSPYLYLTKLLQTHNLTLLDVNTELNTGFHCLLKFKVLYNQDILNQQTKVLNNKVTLWLALFCSNSVFCFKVKDQNNQEIDINKISPHWQWEVIKIFKGEVVDRLLTNAQKISQEVFEYANTFSCLLKSINVKRLP